MEKWTRSARGRKSMYLMHNTVINLFLILVNTYKFVSYIFFHNAHNILHNCIYDKQIIEL